MKYSLAYKWDLCFCFVAVIKMVVQGMEKNFQALPGFGAMKRAHQEPRYVPTNALLNSTLRSRSSVNLLKHSMYTNQMFKILWFYGLLNSPKVESRTKVDRLKRTPVIVSHFPSQFHPWSYFGFQFSSRWLIASSRLGFWIGSSASSAHVIPALFRGNALPPLADLRCCRILKQRS